MTKIYDVLPEGVTAFTGDWFCIKVLNFDRVTAVRGRTPPQQPITLKKQQPITTN